MTLAAVILGLVTLQRLGELEHGDQLEDESERAAAIVTSSHTCT